MAVRIENKTYDGNRDLFGIDNVQLSGCTFEGTDGDALRECGVVEAKDCSFASPYPVWHGQSVALDKCSFAQKSRDALWYSQNINIVASLLHAPRMLRECKNIVMRDCDVNSSEFGWEANGVRLTDSKAAGEYFMMRGKNLAVRRLEFKGKFCFQYIRDAIIMDSTFVTDAALWHSNDVVMENCVLVGEKLGWYSKNLTLKNCTVIGSKPLCYCRNLHLTDCVMQEVDMAFERSEVYAVLRGKIGSILNPTKGVIKAPEVGEVVRTDPYARCKVLVDPNLMRGFRND